MSQFKGAGAGASSSNSSNGAGGPPSMGGLPDALLERMMDRKLRMLDLEYEECIKATKGYNMDDYDHGPTGDDEPDAETVKARGYAAFGAGESASSSSLPVSSEDGGAAAGAAGADDEWSEAWADYKRECAEEEAEAKSRGLTQEDVDRQTSAPDPPRPVLPLTGDTIQKIQGVMAGIKIKPPMWALGVPEEVWMAQILQRVGIRGPQPAPSANANNENAASAAAAHQKELERKKRAKQKKKRAAKAAAAAAAAAIPSTQPASATPSTSSASAHDDFQFPPLAASAASTATPSSAPGGAALHSPD